MRKKRLLSYLDKIVHIDDQQVREIQRLRKSNELLNQRAQKAEQKYIQLKKKQADKNLGSR